MDKSIQEIAVQLAEAEELVRMLGMQNRPEDPIEQLRADARYRLATSARDMTRQAYENMLERMSTDDMLKLLR